MRHQPPLATGAGDVQQRIYDLAALVFGGTASRFGSRDEATDLSPLRPGQIARVRYASAHTPRLGHLF